MNRLSMVLLGVVALVFVFALSAFWPSGGPASRTAAPSGGTGSAPADPEVVQGKDLASRFGCLACHSVDGSRLLGASWKGLAGSERPLEGGQRVVADDSYLAESIVDPDARVVQGYTPGLMGPATQAFRGDLAAPENQRALIAYIKSLR
jgi:cytochrome c oxidase subunit 2